MVTIKDVARRARVGVSTVSRVLNDHPDVSPETREKVLQVARKLGYRPHSGARQLVRDTPETICFVISNREVLNPFHSRILVGVENYARGVSHSVIFIRFDYPPDTPPEELALPRVIWERGAVDGVVIAGTNYQNFVKAVKNLGLPFVLLGNNLIGRMSVEDMDTIWFDNKEGTRRATEYLISLGHQDIRFVADLKLPWYRRCHQGYVASMTAHGLAPALLEVEREGTVFEFGMAAAERVFKLGDRVTAVVAGDDEIALGVLAGLNPYGVKVPEDISLVGFDDIEELKYLHPPLTTIRVPKEKIGEELAKTLFERLANPRAPVVKRFIPTELVIRESCAEPRIRREPVSALSSGGAPEGATGT